MHLSRLRNVLLLSLILLPALVVVPVESARAAAAPKLKQIAMIDLPGAPGFDGLALVGTQLLITHNGAGTLDVFDTAKRRVVQQVAGLDDLQGIAVDGRAGRVYLSNARGKSISVVSMRDWKVVQTIALDAAPYHLAISPDGALLFSANWLDQSVTEIDVMHGQVVGTVSLGGTPRSLAYDAERRVVYVSLQDTSEVAAIDANLKVVSRYKLLASQPTGLALDTAARRLYVAVRHAVVQLQLDAGTEVRRVAAPAGANSLWLDSASGTLYLASGGGYINMMNTASGAFVALDEVHSDVRGSTLAYDAAHGLVYMPGGRDGRSKLLILKRTDAGAATQ
jgi:YVTN family beta-propeller protein